jgi:hypothetical protein
MANASNTSANRYKGHDIDTDGDGRVGKADHASNAQAYKGNDIDSDGDGIVDEAATSSDRPQPGQNISENADGTWDASGGHPKAPVWGDYDNLPASGALPVGPTLDSGTYDISQGEHYKVGEWTADVEAQRLFLDYTVHQSGNWTHAELHRKSDGQQYEWPSKSSDDTGSYTEMHTQLSQDHSPGDTYEVYVYGEYSCTMRYEFHGLDRNQQARDF